MQYGLEIQHTEAREPQFFIDTFHCNFRDYAVYTDGIQWLRCHNVFSVNPNAGQEGTGPDPKDIFIQNSLTAEVSACKFYFAGDPNRTNVHISSGSNGTLGLASTHTRIDDNTFDAVAKNAIYVSSDAGYVTIDNPQVGNDASYTSGFLNDQSGKVMIHGMQRGDTAGVVDEAQVANFPAKRLLTRFSSTPANESTLGRLVWEKAFSRTATPDEVFSIEPYMPNTASLSGAAKFKVVRAAVTTTEMTLGGGLLMGTATGGAKGTGTINATAVYDDNSALTCYVIQGWKDGAIDTDFWDSVVPDRKHPAETGLKTEKDPDTGKETEIKYEISAAWTEVRDHVAAQGFAKVFEDRLDPDKYRDWVYENGHLPAFPNPEEWADLYSGNMSSGELIQRLWETVEVQFVHLAKTRDELKGLERRIEALEPGWAGK